MLNKSEMVMLTSWIRPPPAAPCSARPTMSIVMLTDRAHMMELPQNSATAARRMGLRPQISDSLAHIGAAAALASRYAPPIQV